MLPKRDLELTRIPIDDLDQVLEIERLCFSQPWTLDNFLAEFERPYAVILGLYQDRRLTAQCFSWLLPPEGYLLSLAVRPDLQGRGLARRLLESWLTLCRRADVVSMRLEASAVNVPALRLYRSLGFRRTGLRRRYYADGTDAVLMTLDLEPGPPARP
ncbi:MAG: ribosomal protein S18-alanine N-acetyltransferase [Deltaproteobacteria bacterium]|jgi:ribosomal-protein-alanine N-acetyltransferase|nr:ribosomal protein S18-alanine N-acetyltransferase [Deltaproteobacteria bacterium]